MGGTSAGIKNDLLHAEKKLTLEGELKARGFKEINKILNWKNPVSKNDLKFCLKNLIYETYEHKK